MIIQQDVSARDAADLLHIDACMVARLCRYLGINSGEQRIPVDVLERAGRHEQPEERYAALRSWLLHQYISAREETSRTANGRYPSH